MLFPDVPSEADGEAAVPEIPSPGQRPDRDGATIQAELTGELLEGRPEEFLERGARAARTPIHGFAEELSKGLELVPGLSSAERRDDEPLDERTEALRFTSAGKAWRRSGEDAPGGGLRHGGQVHDNAVRDVRCARRERHELAGVTEDEEQQSLISLTFFSSCCPAEH